MEDMLLKMFEMQKSLNKYCGEKNGIPELVDLDNLTLDQRQEWVLTYNKALRKESEELDDCEDWKFWHTTREAFDWQNAKIEIIDMWHFLMSVTIMAGMTPDDLFKVYVQKWEVNFKRQDNGYTKGSKTEEDNRNIEV